MDCVFCKISSGEIKTLKVYEDGTCAAFPEINPAGQGHMVIISKVHHENLSDVSAQEFLNAWSVARFLVQILDEEFKPKGYNALLSVGEVKNQQTKHFSIHLIPISGNEEVYMGWKPVKLDEGKAKTVALKVEAKLKEQVEAARKKMEDKSSELIKVVKMPRRRHP